MNKLRWKKGIKRKWTEEEDGKFIKVWATKYNELCGPTQNSVIYKDMVVELAWIGVEVTVMEVRYKIKNLKDKYRSLKKNYDPKSPPKWCFYKTLNAFVDKQPVYRKKTPTLAESPNNVEPSTNVEQDYETLEVDAIELTTVKSESSCSPTVVNEALSDCSLLVPSNTAIPNGTTERNTTDEQNARVESNTAGEPNPTDEQNTTGERNTAGECNTTGERNTSGERIEQGIAALLNVCNRLSENMEVHLSQSLEVQKQKLNELRAIRLATSKLTAGFLDFLKSNSGD